VQVNDINLTSGTLKAIDDTLFFWVEGDEAVQGIWASKGDETSTHRIKAFSTDVYWFDSFVKDGIYYFILDNADNGKRELWRSDGTEAGTFKLIETAFAGG
jgi:ELWxxDGT repeat protein